MYLFTVYCLTTGCHHRTMSAASGAHTTQVGDLMTLLHNNIPLIPSPVSQADVAAPGAVLTFELSFRANPVALLAWGQARVAMATPCEWSKLQEMRAQGVAAATAAAHHHFSLFFL